MRRLGTFGLALAAFAVAAIIMSVTPASADTFPHSDEKIASAGDVHTYFDTSSADDCENHHEHQECGLSSGTCTSHFAGTPLQAEYAGDVKLPVKPAEDEVKFSALIFDLLRPPRV